MLQQFHVFTAYLLCFSCLSSCSKRGRFQDLYDNLRVEKLRITAEAKAYIRSYRLKAIDASDYRLVREIYEQKSTQTNQLLEDLISHLNTAPKIRTGQETNRILAKLDEVKTQETWSIEQALNEINSRPSQMVTGGEIILLIAAVSTTIHVAKELINSVDDADEQSRKEIVVELNKLKWPSFGELAEEVKREEL